MKWNLVPCTLMLAYGFFHMPAQVAAETPGEKQYVEITAKRFEYQPHVITLQAGTAAELHIRSKDALHGFHIPSLKLRADLMPGKTVKVSLPPLEKGEYPFLCDIFCGTDHSHMQGRLVVQ